MAWSRYFCDGLKSSMYDNIVLSVVLYEYTNRKSRYDSSLNRQCFIGVHSPRSTDWEYAWKYRPLRERGKLPFLCGVPRTWLVVGVIGLKLSFIRYFLDLCGIWRLPHMPENTENTPTKRLTLRVLPSPTPNPIDYQSNPSMCLLG